MQITVRHGGEHEVATYREEIVRQLKGYGMFEMWFIRCGPNTPTAIQVYFGPGPFQVDTEANVVHKVREALRRVDNPQWEQR